VHVELARRAVRDLRDARRADELDPVGRALGALRDEEAGLDVVALVGRAPWRRLRPGDRRILFRPLGSSELASLGVEGPGILVARIVNPRELGRAIRSL
jgi:hypothetical protein